MGGRKYKWMYKLEYEYLMEWWMARGTFGSPDVSKTQFVW